MAESERVAESKKAKRQVMGALGIEGEEKWSDQGIRRHGEGFYDASDRSTFCTEGKKKERRGLHI